MLLLINQIIRLMRFESQHMKQPFGFTRIYFMSFSLCESGKCYSIITVLWAIITLELAILLILNANVFQTCM